MTKTIDPSDAQDLMWNEDGTTFDDWTRLTDILKETRRWYESRILVLRHADGSVWGLNYSKGMTEQQESEYPWDDLAGPVPLTRLYPHEVTTIEYRTTA